MSKSKRKNTAAQQYAPEVQAMVERFAAQGINMPGDLVSDFLAYGNGDTSKAASAEEVNRRLTVHGLGFNEKNFGVLELLDLTAKTRGARAIVCPKVNADGSRHACHYEPLADFCKANNVSLTQLDAMNAEEIGKLTSLEYEVGVTPACWFEHGAV